MWTQCRGGHGGAGWRSCGVLRLCGEGGWQSFLLIVNHTSRSSRPGIDGRFGSMWNVLIPTLAAILVVLGAIDAGALPF
jgi:hypothetical protein